MAAHWNCLVLFLATTSCVHGTLKFANSIADHMVLQRAPQRAILWGYADVIGDTVTVEKNGAQVGQTTVKNFSSGTETMGIWKVKLPAESNPGPFSITVRSSEGSITINDVLFGDVWICSGQSNMQFNMHQVNNSAEEIKDSLNYPNVRMLFSKLNASDQPLTDVQLQVSWMKPTKGVIDWFSAVCFMFARDLQSHLNYPIGVIESNWGGTAIEVWSSTDALNSCSGNSTANTRKRAGHPTKPSVLWNSMIHPYLNTTIKGAIWYQGESNAGHYVKYACQFPAMIDDWRKNFYAGTEGETERQFPFGFVQLAPYRPEERVSAVAFERWAQTANYGYAPNPAMPKTFMAVAVDLPDFASPSGSIHPRYKQDVAARLVLGALHEAYGDTTVAFQGPFPTDLFLTTRQGNTVLRIEYRNESDILEIKNKTGFEVCCTSHCNEFRPWTSAPIALHNTAIVELDISGCPAGSQVTGVRYIWRESPCALHMCPIYSATTHLPAPPFRKMGGFPTKASSNFIG